MANILKRPGNNIEASSRSAHDNAHFGSAFPSPGEGKSDQPSEKITSRKKSALAKFPQQWSAVFDHLEENLLGPCTSRRRMSIARFTLSRIGESTSQIARTLYF